jgi:hypothetical protein
MMKIQSMFIISGYIHFQLVMNVTCLTQFLVVAQFIPNPIHFVIDESNNPLSLTCWSSPMNPEHFFLEAKFFNSVFLLLFY